MNTTVRVEAGLLAGVSSPDGVVRSFKGVPFAKPPVGDLRWRPPQLAEPWEGMRRADAYAPGCTQMALPEDSIFFTGHEKHSEDCLYLNVWTAAESDGDRRPVMVWLYLGAFQFGSGSSPWYDGEQLARAGAVVVTLNYRLGRLGFLAHPDLTRESGHNASGNYGLLDQIGALRWVQRNITAFGGDPDCVTVFGTSAGSHSVSFLMASPLAKGLFQRAIGQSGAGFGPVLDTCGITDTMPDLHAAEQTGLKLASAMGATSIEELRARSAEELLAAQLSGDAGGVFETGSMPKGTFDSGWPILDGYVLPAGVYDVFVKGKQNDVPLVTGSNANEASGVPGTASARAFVEEARAEYGDMADEFLRLFPASTDAEAFFSSSAANADRIFVWQNYTWARLHSRAGRSKTYYYHWRHVPPIPSDAKYAERDPATLLGAFHASEIPFVFRHLEVLSWPWRPIDYQVRDAISSYWLNFARTGDPNGTGLPGWPAFSEEAPQAMHFGDGAKMGPVPSRERLDFWERFYAQLRDRYGPA